MNTPPYSWLRPVHAPESFLHFLAYLNVPFLPVFLYLTADSIVRKEGPALLLGVLIIGFYLDLARRRLQKPLETLSGHSPQRLPASAGYAAYVLAANLLLATAPAPDGAGQTLASALLYLPVYLPFYLWPQAFLAACAGLFGYHVHRLVLDPPQAAPAYVLSPHPSHRPGPLAARRLAPGLYALPRTAPR